MDDFKEYLTLILAVFSLIISIINMLFIWYNKKKEKAPVLEINQSCYNGSKYSIPEVVSQKDTERESFILDRRLFIEKESNSIEPHFSLIIDTALEEQEPIESIGFDTLVIRNVGFSLSKITIEKIQFTHDKEGVEDGYLVLNNSNRNKLYLNMHNGDEIRILISGKFGRKGYQPLISEKLNDIDGKYASNLSKIKGTNLLNTRCISEADNWSSIIVIIRTENIFGEEYQQIINFRIENNTYYMNTSRPQIVN